MQMQTRESAPQLRSKTLPLNKNQQIRSAKKIKISKKGLPKDFFSNYLEESSVRSNSIRRKTESYHNQLEQTSYFPKWDTISHKKEARWYKSEERSRTSTETEKQERHNLKKIDDRGDVLEYTFFKTVALQRRVKEREGDGKVLVRTNQRQQGLQLSDLEPILNNSDMNGFLRPRQCVKLNRLRPGLYKGLPMIRLCKPKAK